MWLPPILKRFRQLYPNVRIDIKEGGNREMTRWLNEMSVDCCFFVFPYIPVEIYQGVSYNNWRILTAGISG
ncbi:LysR family transcriptional regulator substrate-binding protein [Enterocloster clostridioformis]|uniref:LysR family transcriptional regulator substrate-binding protein n=1 Tax=Enterocloster clostridioformis TaxID=1531 RepID=UPI00321A32AC